MRVLVTGSREWSDLKAMRDAFAEWWMSERPETATLVSGSADGADRMAESLWTRAAGDIERHPAQWRTHGGCWCKDRTGRCGFAGPRRNAEMVNAGADVCFAFFKRGAGNRGTKNCSDLARKAGIKVIEVWGE